MERKTDSTTSDSKRINREATNVNDPNVQGLGPSFDDLPSSIFTDVLLRLPMKSLLICRCVCKRWRALISDPQFAESHFKNSEVHVVIRTNVTLYLLEFEPSKFANGHSSGHYPHMNRTKLHVKFKLPLCAAKKVYDKSGETIRPYDFKFDVVNSCNGFLCLCDYNKRNPFLVCNPITGEFIRLPEVSKGEKFSGLIGSGFGYNPRTNEYKILRVCYPRHGNDSRSIFAEIHTLGTGVRKSVLNCPSLCRLESPTYLNGALYWLCTSIGEIISFNFETDKFHENQTVVDWHRISMGELKDCLYICDSSICDGPMQMWVRVKESWTEVFHIKFWGSAPGPLDALYKPIKYVEEDILLMYHSPNCIIYYDCGKHVYKYFTVRGSLRLFEAISHIPSLVSLKDAVKGDNVEVMNVNSGFSELKYVEEKEDLFLVSMHPAPPMT